jgi:hypothetical protein
MARSSKRSLENNVKSSRGKRKIHTLEIGGHVQMAKGVQRKSSLSDCTWLESEYGSFNLEALKFLMHFRESGSSLILFYTYLHFFSFSLTFFSFFLFLIFASFSFPKKIYLLPLNSKITLYLPPPPCLDICSSSGKEVIKIR